MFGSNLQRSYKYIMYATKTPSLRIHHSDLKCKRGCGFYGNAQWQGYCSKCHREQTHRQKRAEKASAGTSATQREHQVLERQPKTTQVAGFSKFEEKKLRQSDSLKKNKLLKLNVFRKASNAKDVGPGDREVRDRGPPELTIPVSALENQKLDFAQCFPNLDSNIERDTRKYIQAFFSSLVKQYHSKTVDELSDLTQNFYQVFAKRMETSQNYYTDVDSETRELLLDFVEKHSMTYLHGVLFSPGSCDDEKKDAQLQTRIRQLCWVSPKHLDCRIDQRNSKVRDLLYAAISELIAMDSIPSPGGKLFRVVECCRGVVKLVGAAGGGPASADELLPALIFTVLKANPPRLTSNINFVTRFCNAARLMTGEGGYYFTNLCCAVSFIENLTPESLSMTKEDFDGYMSLPAIVGGGSWVAALSLCEGLHDLQDQIKHLQELDRRTVYIENEAKNLEDQVESFKEEILKKISDVLTRTPLDINKKRTLDSKDTDQLIIEPINSEHNSESKILPIPSDEIKAIPTEDIFGSCADDKTIALMESIPATLRTKSPNPVPSQSSVFAPSTSLLPPNSLSNLTSALDTPPMSTLKTIGSGEFLSPSPILGFGSFDTQSLDELATPDEYGSEPFLHGLTNVNYDIDLSDLSAENSAAEDVPVERFRSNQDPFSPEGLVKPNNDPWKVLPSEPSLQRENPLPRPQLLLHTQDEAATSILDANDSPTVDCLLPSPIKPLSFQPPGDNQKT